MQDKQKQKYAKINQSQNAEKLDFLGGSGIKNLPANAGDMGFIPGPGRSHLPWNN